MYFQRKLYDSIIYSLFKGKAIILYGPRQVGKTTLITKISSDFEGQGKNVKIIDLEDRENRDLIEQSNSIRRIEQNFSHLDILIIDEAQKYDTIGSFAKLCIDHFPRLQLIMTGSSSFDLANKTSEPLTGRKYEFNIYPISLEELRDNTDPLSVLQSLDEVLIYGTYPDIINSQQKERDLEEISKSYLYKDTLIQDTSLDESIIRRILQLLAFQVGSEVSYNELAGKLGIAQQTVIKYIHSLEKAFIIHTLSSLSKNPRKEITKKKKIYFWDNGIRNAVIKSFNDLSLRNDVGQLWENFCIMERVKFLKYNSIRKNIYFWRNYNQFEIDWVEESNDSYQALEFKYNVRKKVKPTPSYKKTYPNSTFSVISRANIFDLIEKNL